jgi:hypothetical protein
VSDYRAIAATTVTLQNMLQPAVTAAVPGAIVKTGRPEKTPVTNAPGEVNIYLYQVTPNAALRNAELVVRRGDGTLIRRPQLALDLHYLLSFYGDDLKLIPQILMGATASMLHAQPHPAAEDIPSGEGHPFAATGLDQQVERLRFVPMMLSHDELSKLWSIFFQVPYTLSLSYLCSVVLIEADLTPEPALPIRRADWIATPALPPQIEQVNPQVVLPGGKITLRGRNLRKEDTVRVAGRDTTPEAVAAGALVVPLPEGLAAGVHTVQVVRLPRGPASNTAAFVLQPVVREVQADPGKLRLRVEPPVAPGQSVSVLLNEVGSNQPASAVLVLRNPQGAELEVAVPTVAAGTYLVRVQVDGAASNLEVDADPGSPTFEQYSGPKVVIG